MNRPTPIYRGAHPCRPAKLQRLAGQAAFTLIEVILAIGITIGLLLVAIYFYHQSAQLRNQLLEQTEKISELQAAFDRLTADLRSAFASPHEVFSGNATSMSFTIAAAPRFPTRLSSGVQIQGDQGSVGLPDSPTRSAEASQPSTDLHQIQYEALYHREGTNQWIEGLGRSEYLNLEPVQSSTAATAPSTLPTVTQLNLGLATKSAAAETNSVVTGPRPPMFASSIRHVLFRYSDGRNWVENWTGSTPPLGVEITFALESPPQELISTDNTVSQPQESSTEFETFRRVVYIPGGVRSP